MDLINTYDFNSDHNEADEAGISAGNESGNAESGNAESGNAESGNAESPSQQQQPQIQQSVQHVTFQNTPGFSIGSKARARLPKLELLIFD